MEPDKPKSIWLSHPTGNTFVRALLDSISRSGRSFSFFTTLGVAESSRWPGLLPGKLRAEIERRAYRVPPERLVTWPAIEIGRLLAARMGWRRALRHETGWFCVDAVYRRLDDKVAARLRRAREADLPRVAYAYEDGALGTFLAARERGARRVYELPIAYWETSRRLLREEAARLPEWEPTLQATRDSEAKIERKRRELEEAEAVVCPSQFVLDSLPEGIRRIKKCIVAPFGSPGEGLKGPGAPKDAGRPFRFLFAGSMSQRKGLADLFEAAKLLRDRRFELVVMGSPVAPLEFYRRQLADFVHEPTRPHSGVMKLMASCDVLVLPSIVEGRALVQQEALSQGLPLIVTANAGGEDLIEEGRTGFLVPIRSPASIAEKMAWFLDHPSELEGMKDAAREMAAARTWLDYGSKILDLTDSL